jgi:acetyltransferase-like isoleucine patch superfamily enzyme
MINARILPSGRIGYEGQCYFHSGSQVLSPIDVGAFTYFGDGCMIGSLNIGRFCSVAPDVKIGLGEHEVSHVSTHPIFYGAKNGFAVPDGIGTVRDLKLPKHAATKIGHDVWVGANSVISRGVKIGNGAVIAAGAIVNKDVEPYSIVGGVPAKHIKYRFDADTIERLIKSEWWNLDVSNFIGVDASDPNAFLDALDKIENKKLANYPKSTKLHTD